MKEKTFFEEYGEEIIKNLRKNGKVKVDLKWQDGVRIYYIFAKGDKYTINHFINNYHLDWKKDNLDMEMVKETLRFWLSFPYKSPMIVEIV